jgi:hypothetical protein
VRQPTRQTGFMGESRVRMAFWIASLVIPFFTSWLYSAYVWRDGGLHFHPEFPVTIYVMSGLSAVVAVWAVLSSDLKWWAKGMLCLGSVGLQILVSFLGVFLELYQSGLGYNGG